MGRHLGADRAAIDAVSGTKLAAYGGQAFDDFTNGSFDQMRKAGVSIKDASPHLVVELKERLKPMRYTWVKAAAAKGVDGSAAIPYYRSQAFN